MPPSGDRGTTLEILFYLLLFKAILILRKLGNAFLFAKHTHIIGPFKVDQRVAEQH